MPGLEFSVPYNGDMRSIPDILALQGTGGNRIREIFLSGPADFAGSGRVAPGNKALGDAGVFERLSTCGEHCEECTWCADTVDELLRLER